jgi:hypothetical protein
VSSDSTISGQGWLTAIATFIALTLKQTTRRLQRRQGPARRLRRVKRDELIQAAERTLFEAEQAYRAEPSELNQRRMQRAWTEVREARGEPSDDDVPFPFLSSRPRDH